MLRSMASIELDHSATYESDYHERSAKREMGPRMMTNQMSPSSGLIWNRALEKMMKEWVGNIFYNIKYCHKQAAQGLYQRRLRRDAKITSECNSAV